MSLPTMELTDVLKNAPTASSLSGRSMLCVDSLGMFAICDQLRFNQNVPSCMDADNPPLGFARTLSNTQNLPSSGNGGWLLTLGWDPVALFQLFFRWQTYVDICVRKRNSPDGVFSAWKRVLAEVIT